MNLLDKDRMFMYRCLELAQRAQGMVAPNPMVGAVLVYQDRIIGEGYHQQYGKAHAEVNCIHSVAEEDRAFISQSTLYVSLEPCAHFGKTPPCVDLILTYKIPKVVIACRDSFEQVNGKGIEKLKAAGVDVVLGILEKEAIELNKRFFTFHQYKRPYIILKWAQTANNIMGRNSNDRLMISGKSSQVLVHRWRTEEQAILVGTNTALRDNPKLTDRYHHSRQPIRIVLDRSLKIPEEYHVFDGSATTYIMNEMKDGIKNNVHWIKLDHWSLTSLRNKWYELNIQSILVEGGAHLFESFLKENCWDEIRVIQNPQLEATLDDAIFAPTIRHAKLIETLSMENDQIYTYVSTSKVKR